MCNGTVGAACSHHVLLLPGTVVRDAQQILRASWRSSYAISTMKKIRRDRRRSSSLKNRTLLRPQALLQVKQQKRIVRNREKNMY